MMNTKKINIIKAQINLKKRIYFISSLLFLFLPLTFCTAEITGDSAKGWDAFYTKGCIVCHSVWGEGGKEGPELATAGGSRKDISVSALAAGMWNHAPVMLEHRILKKTPGESISQEEMSDIFAFLVFMRSNIEIGNSEDGEKVFKTKKCGFCHTLRGEGGSVGPELTEWGRYSSPVVWASLMLNHASDMKSAMKDSGIMWPIFSGSEMADLVAYVKEVSGSAEKEYLSPGSPSEGKNIFSKKGCAGCHSIFGKGGGTGPDLSRRFADDEDESRTISQLAGLMWNHVPQMIASGANIGRRGTRFSPDEMSDLIAYLFSIKYVEQSGNSKRGEEQFVKKKCVTCHVAGKTVESGKVKIPLEEREVSSIYMAWAMWNHGPQMREEMKDKGISWPLMDSYELRNIVEYLKNN